MPSPPSDMSADYTRTAGPHGRVVSALLAPMTPRSAALYFLGGLIVALLFLPADGTIFQWMAIFQPGARFGIDGDLWREMIVLQQYGAVSSLVLIATAIFLLDPRARTRLLDGIVAILANVLVINIVKILAGRPRPKLGDPLGFCGPFIRFPLPRDGDPVAAGVQHVTQWRYSWEVWGNIKADLWSMPSSHTATAMALSAVLIRLYPRIWPLALLMALAVGVCRVIFLAHYPSDIVIGASIGFIVGSAAMDWRWGQRLVEKLRTRRASNIAPSPSPET